MPGKGAGDKEGQDMGDPMKTGGFGKSPAIDRLNGGGIAAGNLSAAGGLAERMFAPAHPREQAVLYRRQEIMEAFRIDFRRKERAEDGKILHGGERGVQPGGDPAGDPGYERTGAASGTPGRFWADGRRTAGTAVSMGRPAGDPVGEGHRTTDGTADRTETGASGNLAGRMGTAGDGRRTVSGVRKIPGLSG